MDPTNYVRRLTRVTAYLYDHLDEELDLQTLAEVACLSAWHWHRIYHAVLGESVVATVKRLRLQRAAAELAQTALPLDAVAARAGYPSLPSFTRVFKAAYGRPPADYRRSGSHTHFAPQAEERATALYDVTLRDIPRTRLAGLGHRGPYLEIGRAFDSLFGILGARGLIAPDTRLLAIYRDDPTAVPAAELRSFAGVTAGADFPLEPPLEPAEIAAGPYAVLRHKGPYADMKAAYAWLYGDWLVQSGREAADAPVFEEYLNNPRAVPPTELLTDIFLPLR